jgi:hypothetical protein
MANDEDEDKAAPPGQRRAAAAEPGRFVYGPRPLSALLPPLVRPAFRGHAAATAQLLADWPAIVGPAYASLTTPRRLASGTLTLACSGTVAMELQHFAPLLMERINGHLGRAAVSRLKFVQAALRQPAAPALSAPQPALRAAREAVASLPPGDLRDALERLARAVLARHP